MFYTNLKIGWSKFLTCVFTTDSYTAQYNDTFYDSFNTILGPEIKWAEVMSVPLTREVLTNGVLAAMAGAGPFCAAGEDNQYLAHLNTPNIARDLELIRSLMGHEELDLWGTGYGATVDMMYAALFPDRVGRIILDGVAKQK